MEVLPVGAQVRRNRKWPYEVKSRIVAETVKPALTVNAVARPHGVPANHVSAWRALARKGRLVLPARESRVKLALLKIGPAADGPRCALGVVDRPEIVTGALAIRLEAGASADRIGSVVRAWL
ncbi:MAG: IS66 family insertion sequence hypothetical protein [Paracoccus denitrificans]|nr:MAG: IS66 family insertion sequence hypothetical protein [Paracoccus denitrificans]PZO83066.1 MAG: IS66 family insertion sequence hypothetical protein [Paracoccus denitrificans]